jgi:trimeric autotransporter adhesin
MKFLITIIFTAFILVGAAFGQTSSFNYQGKLTETGAAANGTYQFTFRLYDAPAAGSQVGPTLSDVSVTVADGTFSANLDFGVSSFTGADRYLDVSVRKNAGDPYTPLTPRQKINSAPYATKAAKSADADAIGGQSAASVASAVEAVNNATAANTANAIARRDANGQITVGSLKFQDGTSMTTAASGGANILGSANTWTGSNTFNGGVTVGNPVNAGDAVNKGFLDANTIKFVPGAEQLSVGDANGTAPMINLRGGSTCCSSPGGHTPAWFKVFQNGSFVATGNLGIGVSPMQGKGYRTSWDSYKGAFRSGYADNEWDDAKVGFFSWAGGSNSTAVGLYALAFGDTNSAESTSSIVFGSGNQVKGAAGFSAGAGNRVCDTYGVALGNNAKSGGPLINGKCDPDTFNIRGLAAVAIGYNVTADQDHTTAMGKFASNNGWQGTFIWSDGSAQQSADTFRNTTNNEFAARATGGFRFRTNLAGTTGCNLPAGSGVFNCTSSRYTKENFVSAAGVLASLRKIPVSTWNYISEGREVRHLGPMAEDFFAEFKLGTGNTSIGVQDLAGVSIAAVKELDEQLQQKNAEIERLQNEIKALRSNQTELEKRLQAIEHTLSKQQ